MTAPYPSRMSRRGFLAAASATAAAACVGWPGSRAFAEDEKKGEGLVQMMRRGAAEVKLDVQALRGNVQVLIGSGGNVGVLAGADGLLLVDSGLAGSQPQITKALAGISDRPLKFVVNTHWHFDHCDGNAWARAAGATLIAHPNTKKHLSKETRVPDWDFTFPPAPEAALPTETVEDRRDVRINGTTAA